MIRNSDTYIGLRERTERARSKNADMFLSLHADAFPRKEAKGSSVYALSLKGASSEAAKFLAEQENSYDPLEGIDMDDMSADLKRTLIELSQSSTLESSLDMGGRILNRLGRVGNVHKPNVEQANFAFHRCWLKQHSFPICVKNANSIHHASRRSWHWRYGQGCWTI